MAAGVWSGLSGFPASPLMRRPKPDRDNDSKTAISDVGSEQGLVSHDVQLAIETSIQSIDDATSAHDIDATGSFVSGCLSKIARHDQPNASSDSEHHSEQSASNITSGQACSSYSRQRTCSETCGEQAPASASQATAAKAKATASIALASLDISNCAWQQSKTTTTGHVV